MIYELRFTIKSYWTSWVEIINLKFKIINLKPLPLDPIPDLLQSHGRESFLYRAV